MPATFKGSRKAVAEVMTLAPGETRAHRYTALTVWSCCHASTFHPRQSSTGVTSTPTISSWRPPPRITPRIGVTSPKSRP